MVEDRGVWQDTTNVAEESICDCSTSPVVTRYLNDLVGLRRCQRTQLTSLNVIQHFLEHLHLGRALDARRVAAQRILHACGSLDLRDRLSDIGHIVFLGEEHSMRNLQVSRTRAACVR